MPGQGHRRHLAGDYCGIGEVEMQQGPATHWRPPRARYSTARYQACH
jgi:hypothetical protein